MWELFNDGRAEFERNYFDFLMAGSLYNCLDK